MRWFVAVVLICASSPAFGDEAGPPFRPERRCLKLYEAHEYAEAAECMREMYALVPAPALLFNIAQTERLAGNCRDAIPYYEKFLGTNPKPEQAAQATERLEECRAKVAAEPPPPVAPPPAVEPPPPVAPLPAAPTPPRRSGLPSFLLASGLVAIGMGALLLAADLSDDTDAYVTLGVGGALVVVGFATSF